MISYDNERYGVCISTYLEVISFVVLSDPSNFVSCKVSIETLQNILR